MKSISLPLRHTASSVTEYLNSTTQNPLVVTDDVTRRSDMRIFSSDGNVTMNRYGNAVVYSSTRDFIDNFNQASRIQLRLRTPARAS